MKYDKDNINMEKWNKLVDAESECESVECGIRNCECGAVHDQDELGGQCMACGGYVEDEGMSL